MIKLIVAYDAQRGIGLSGRMPWSIPEEMKIFRTLTMGHSIVFGKTTYLGIAKALPGRTNFVVTHQLDFDPKDAQVLLIHDFEAFLKQHEKDDAVYFICGGRTLYQQALPYVSEASVSVINASYPCDTVFPDVDWSEFDVISETQYGVFKHLIYRRKA